MLTSLTVDADDMHISCIGMEADDLVFFIVGNSTDTLELAADFMQYELPEPHVMSEN